MAGAVWGLDIGYSSIKAVKLERSGNVAVLSAFDVIEVEFSDNEDTRSSRVRAAIAELFQRQNIGKDPVVVSIPGNQTFYRPFPLPAGGSKLRELVGFEARNQIPFPIEEVLFDYKEITRDESGSPRVGLVAVRRELVDDILGQLKEFGVQVEAIQVAPLALYGLMQYEYGDDSNWLILDGGARVTDFVVADKEEFWFRPLPQSGNELTRALEQKFRMSYEEAESLKLKMGESKQAQKIFQVLEPQLRNFVGDIQRTINYYVGIRGAGGGVGPIMLVGNSFKLPGLVDFLKKSIDNEIQVYDGLQKIRIGMGVDANWWADENQAMGVALGLALQGLGLTNNALELLPEELVRSRLMHKKKPSLITAAIIAVLALGISFVASTRKNDALQSIYKQIENGLRRAENKKREIAGIKFDQEKARLERITKETAHNRGWLMECVDSLGRASLGSKQVLGPKAAGGNGVHIVGFGAGTETPGDLSDGQANKAVNTWYKHLKKGLGPDVDAPMIAVLNAEVGGELFEGERKPVGKQYSHAQDLRKAISYSSKLYLKNDKTELVGEITRTPEELAEGKITFKQYGKASVVYELKDVERMIWFREVLLDQDWNDEVRVVSEGDDRRPTLSREYMQISLAWVVDDGRLVFKFDEKNEQQAPR